MKSQIKINPDLDLVLEKSTDISPELIWRCWTEPKLLMQWFCPRPWMTTQCEMDLKPGGYFRTVMQSPEGVQYPSEGCFLEVEKNQKLIWTSAMLAGYRPVPKSDNGAGMAFTAAVLIEPTGKGSKYTAIAIHKDKEDREQHAKMGFHEGWGAAFDQLVALAKTL